MAIGAHVGNGGAGAPALDSLFASVNPQQLGGQGLFTLHGALTRFRVVGMTDADGRRRYVHNLTLYHAPTRKYLQCVAWHDHVVDLRPAMATQFAFDVAYLKAVKEEKYGTVLGKDLPAVEFNGNLGVDVIAQYEDRSLTLDG